MFGLFKKYKEKRRQAAIKADNDRRAKIINTITEALKERLEPWITDVKVECYYGNKMGYYINDVFMASITYRDEDDYDWTMGNSPEDNIPEYMDTLLEDYKMIRNGIGKYSHGIPGKINAMFFQEFWPMDQFDWDIKMRKYGEDYKNKVIDSYK